MILFLDFWSNVGGAIIEGLRSLMLTLCETIYKLIIFFFDIFIKLGNAEVLTNEKIMEIYGRIGIILGLFMIFRVTFSIIQYVINPDILFEQKKGLFNIVKKIFVVILLLGITPSLFKTAYDLQRKIIDSEIIPKVIMGTNKKNEDETMGERLAWYAFSTFYSWNETVIDRLETVHDSSSLNYRLDEFYNQCIELQGIENSIIKNEFMGEEHSLSYAFNCVNTRYTINDWKTDSEQQFFVIDFDGNGFIPLVVGFIILWMAIVYTIQVGIRVIQLGYLQLIAPIPIISYLTPKGEETFNKWVKQCTSTYLDFFIRVAVIYFVIFIIDYINSVEFNEAFIGSLGDVTGLEMTWINIVMILALLIFAKKLPNLLKEVFPVSKSAASFDFVLNPKKVLNDTLAAGLIGGTVGALGAGASNAIHGFRNMGKAWKKNGVSMRKWKELTDEERKGLNKKDYNAERRSQLWKRTGVVTGTGFKSMFSVAGGMVGGAKAGLKTKDISKSGEAIKTSNENREKRELRKEAGYHVWNTAGDKILEFAGEPGYTDIVKNRQQAVRDERQRQRDLEDGKRLYFTVGVPKPDSNERKLDPNRAFKHSDYQTSYKQLKDAKDEAKEAELILQNENARLNSAYNNIDLHSEDKDKKAAAEREVANAKERYEIAYGNNKAMQGKLELAKAKHDSNKKIFVDDAKIEDLFKFYADTHAELKPLDSSEIHEDINIDERTVNTPSNDLVSMREKLYGKLNDQEEVLSEAMIAQRDAMAKTPFSEESKEAQKRAREEEEKRDLIREQIANIEKLIGSPTNKPTKMSKSERSRLEKELRKAEANGNATEQARIEKILSEDDKLSE